MSPRNERGSTWFEVEGIVAAPVRCFLIGDLFYFSYARRYFIIITQEC